MSSHFGVVALRDKFKRHVIDDTCTFWYNLTNTKLSEMDAIDILNNICSFISILNTWDTDLNEHNK